MTSPSHGADDTAEVSVRAEELARALVLLTDLQLLYDQEMWEIQDPAFDKLRHVGIHLSVLTGKYANLLEPADHRSHRGDEIDVSDFREAAAPIVADLLIHAAQICNTVGIDLGAALRARYRRNAERFAPHSGFAHLED